MDINLEIKLECRTCGNLIDVRYKKQFHYYVEPCESCLKDEGIYQVEKYKKEVENAN
jgi:hypothetical protein